MIETPTSYITVNNLPQEILLHVFNHLDISDLINCIYVCSSWRQTALDNCLWQKKLITILKTQWSTFICDSKPKYAPDLQRLQTIHPYKVYHFLKKYVPHHLLSDHEEASKIQILMKKINELSLTSAVRDSHTTRRLTFNELFWNWWNNFRRRLSINHTSRLNATTRQRCRFAVFGPGFDQNATSCLFSKLVNVKTKSFEPLNMIPGRMGFGAGLTLRLNNQAQMAALDSSLYFSHKIMEYTQKDYRNSILKKTYTHFLHDFNQLDDFIFDLHYLYSLSGHLSHKFNSQLERIYASRLFTYSNDVNNSSVTSTLLNRLVVSNEMKCLLHGICGIIYALDARETTEQTFYLYTELKTVLKGFPDEIAHKIPIVILYIMPVEDILQNNNVENCIHSNSTKDSTTNEVYLNRDSYSGEDYTFSWCGSLLQPLTCLHLFEFHNPWRLQKCASNDIKALIQCFMWLKSKHPNIHSTITSTNVIHTSST
ncbi:hypothetical protein EWB00_004249 [Schistosoma japonicum]|uniref:F-box domain-containing protein n=2 Tax=Schistosoma japonicum TaxID=6182 RepID=A0A4Z2D5H0_SCHJA|nr:hypothetical protein EWB00_004249 [Schistosoma japonicum]